MHRLVPQFILDNYQAGRFSGTFQAVCLLADVSGFSQMTDALAGHGLHGSEVLAGGMRQVFDPMIRSVMEYGGYVVGFAGDAITALFPVKESVKQAYTNAVASALGIQEYRQKHAEFVTPYGRFNISVKIGLGSGEARWRIVTATNGKRATYYFHGSAIDSAVSSLSLSEPGNTMLCPVAVEVLGQALEGDQKGENFLFTGFSAPLPDPAAIEIPVPNPDHLRVFCSEEVSSHDLTGEFRPAVNLFIGLETKDDRETYLESFLQHVFSLQDMYGGLFSRVDVGDKGTNLLMFWGAPLAQENDVERALNFLLELLKGTGGTVKAGITYLLAYAGYVGGTLQEEYTCYGWGVNLAARLMMAANPGEIWTDEEIARRAGRRFSFQYAGQQKFKGFSHQQNVFKLIKRKEDDQAVFSGGFVGRESELEALGRFIGPVWNGKFAGMLTVVGEPGIGKSRLVDVFRLSHIFTENKSYWAFCQVDEIVRQSLNPFRYWLYRYFQISESMEETQSKQAFNEKMDEIIVSLPDDNLAQSLSRTRSLLGKLLNLNWPDSLYEKLDAQGRYDNTFIALSTLLRGESLKQPVILLIEDIHWIDNDTRAFLSFLERTLTADVNTSYPIAILATSRRGDLGIRFDHAPSKEIVLTELNISNLKQLVEEHLGGTAAPSLLEILRKRAEGNPFFIEQIIRYLQEQGDLDLGRSGWQIRGEQLLDSLPTDISSILIARLDRLNREVKEVVQTASVLGREFELRLLSQMLHGDQSLEEKVRHAVEADILSILSEIRYIFRHALFRDAAYNMQLRTRKQELHRIAVEAFETLYKDQLSLHYSEIAYHADHAGLNDKAKKYYILAGAEAKQAYKNSLAIESYTRALALSSKEDIQERIEQLLARAALYRIVGDRAGQEQDLAVLELLANKQGNDRNRAIVALRQADFALDIGEFQEAQRFAENAITIAESAHAPDVVANAYRTLPLTLARQGYFQQAMQLAQVGLQLTRQVGDRESEGQTLNQLGLITLEQGEPSQARAFFEKSLLIAQEIGNRRLEAQVLNNIGNISGMFENDYVAARKYFEQTLEIVREIGNRIGECHALGNLGWAASILGDFDQARIYLQERVSVARESGSRYLEALGLTNMGAMMVSQGIYTEALKQAEQALNLTHELGDRSAEAWALTYLGHANLGLGNYMDATSRFQIALDIRYSLSQNALAMEPLAGLAEVELAKNDQVAALGYVEQILAYLANGGTLEGTDEPLRVYLTIYLSLTINRDARAGEVLENAHFFLREQVSKIQGETNKEMFIQNVPWRRKIEELWQQKRETKQQDT